MVMKTSSGTLLVNMMEYMHGMTGSASLWVRLFCVIAIATRAKGKVYTLYV